MRINEILKNNFPFKLKYVYFPKIIPSMWLVFLLVKSMNSSFQLSIFIVLCI